jgi:tetratricopeptide (TPR) repeat protein
VLAVIANSYMDDVSRNLAFQLAFCYKIGFGVTQSNQRSQELLVKCGRAQEDLDKITDRIGQPESKSNSRPPTTYHKLETMGHIKLISVSDLYHKGSELERAEREIRREINNIEHYVGKDSQLAMTHTGTLALLCYAQGRWTDAEKLYVKSVQTCGRVLGPVHADTLSALANLAVTYTKQGRWEEAERIQVAVMQITKKNLGEEHPDTLNSMASMASTYRHQGRLKESEELDVRVVETRKRLLGLEHPSTLNSMIHLASIYLNQRRWREARELLKQVI